MGMNMLKEKVEALAQEYVLCFDKTEACRRVGYTDNKNISVTSNVVFQRPDVQARVMELMQERFERYKISEENIRKELSLIAFSNVADIIKEVQNGVIQYKTLDEIPREVLSAVKSITQTAFGIKIEFYDKIAALQQLAKFLGMYELDNKQKQQQGPQIYLPQNNRDTDAVAN